MAEDSEFISYSAQMVEAIVLDFLDFDDPPFDIWWNEEDLVRVDAGELGVSHAG